GLELDIHSCLCSFFFQAEDGIRDRNVTGVQTCALPILKLRVQARAHSGQVAIWLAWRGEAKQHTVSLAANESQPVLLPVALLQRSEERRVGKECRTRWWSEQ